MTKNLILFLAIIFVGIVSYYFIHFGHYPVAIVNGKFITAKALNEEYLVAFQYYVRTLANLGQENDDYVDPNSPVVHKELRRAAMHDLIDKALVTEELKKRIGKDVDSAVDNRISAVNADNKEVAEAAKLLYGLDIESFKSMVLVPQAEKELLEGSLYLEQKKFVDWLKQAETDARVTILTPEFAWDTNKVVVR